MPTITRSTGEFRISSKSYGDYGSTGTYDWVLNLAEIMNGSTVTSAKLNLQVNGYGESGLKLNNGTKISITNVNSANYDVTSLFRNKTNFSASDKFQFSFAVYGGMPYGETYRCNYDGSTTNDIILTITYTLPYTACTAPTEVEAASTNVAPGATVRVSWDGAEAGINNDVASYTVYRSTDQSTWDELATGVTNEYLDVTAPTGNGDSYYYKVQSIGTVAGYDSAMSDAYATLTCAYSAPSVSAVKIDNGTDNVYKLTGGTATLSWTGTAGTNNPIVKYVITRNGGEFEETTETSLTVDVPPAGGNYYYGITPVGTYSDGEEVTSPTVYGYSNPSAPTAVTLAKTTAGKEEDVVLSWMGASSGSLNNITGYNIYRSTSASGTYSLIGHVNATTPSGSYTVTSSDTNGVTYYYKVASVGVHSEGSMSAAYASLLAFWSIPSAEQLSVTPNVVAPGGTAVFSWRNIVGTNNPTTAIEVYGGATGTTLLATLGPTATSYTVTAGSSAGNQIQLRVKPLGTVADGAVSSYVYLNSYGSVTAPTSVSLDNDTVDAGTSATLSWSGAGDGSFNTVTGYEVWRSTSASGTYTLLQSGITGTSLSVTAPSQMGSSYYYKVKAVGEYNTSGLSSASASLTAKVYTAPGAPVATMTPAIAGNTDFPSLSWTASADGTNNPVTGYKIYRATSYNGTYTLLGTVGARVRGMSVDKPETMGSYYYYRVYATAAKEGFTQSESSNIVSLQRMVYTKCQPPTTLSLSATLANPNSPVTLSWNAGTAGSNNPIAGYKVYLDSGNGYVQFATVGAAYTSSLVFTGAAGSLRYFKVQTIGTISGFDSDLSAPVSLKANTAPSAITKFYYDSGLIFENTSITVRWDVPADPDNNISQYQVEYRTRESASAEWGEWTAITPVTTNRFTYNANIARGSRIQFRVRAEDALGLTAPYAETAEMIRNSLPITPTLAYPSDNAVTFDRKPYLVVNVSADPDGHQQYIEMSVDGGTYAVVASPEYATGAITVRCPNQLTTGVLHIIAIRMKDALGAVSGAVSVHVRVNLIQWARQIFRGMIISKPGSYFLDDDLILLNGSWSDDTVSVSNGSWDDDTLVVDDTGGISHQAEVEQLYEYVNTGLSYYELETLTVPDLVGQNYGNIGEGKIGMFDAWGDQMLELYNALKGIYQLRQHTPPSVTITSGMIPTASVINTIRAMVENM